MKAILVLALVVVAVAAVKDVEWDSFKGKYGKKLRKYRKLLDPE